VPYDAFFSHSNIYKDLVEEIALDLEKLYGLKIWIDMWCLIPGESWIPELEKNLNNAKCCVVFLGQENSEAWFQNEVEVALNIQSKNKAYRVIPVLIKDAPDLLPNSFLSGRTAVDLRDIGDKKEQLRLASGIIGCSPKAMMEKIEMEQIDIVDISEKKLEVLKDYSNKGLIEKEVKKEFEIEILRKKMQDLDNRREI